MPDDRDSSLEPAELHQDIERLCKRLHGLVEGAVAIAGRAPDDSVCIPLAEYEDLLKLAGESPDLLGRSVVTFDDNLPGWRKRQRRFREQVLDDLAEREDLDYATFCVILDNLEEGDTTPVPASIGPAMLRAWIRTGDYSETQRWREANSWSQVREEDARTVLDAAVERCGLSRFRTGRTSDDLEFWVETVAPEAYPGPGERLEWLARDVVAPSSDGDVGSLGEFIHHLPWYWYGEIERDDLAERVRALRAIRAIAYSGVEPDRELSEQLLVSWSVLLPEGAPSAEHRVVIAEAVKAAVAGAATDAALADELERWVTAVAPRMYPDLADRLLWFAESVGRPAGDVPPFPEGVVVKVTESVCEWLDELVHESIEDIGAVLRAFRRTPMRACVISEDVETCFDPLVDAMSPDAAGG